MSGGAAPATARGEAEAAPLSDEGPTQVASGATMALLVLTGINLVNYLDRFVPSAVKDLFKADLHLTDAQTSLPVAAFVLVYMVASPVFGALADRVPRKVLIAAGVALWSLATGAAGLATGFGGFLVARALVGVGEAAYGTLSPSLLGDYYPAVRRNRVLTIFYVAIPIGAALGYALGGQFGQRYGWRAAFMLCGFPGLLLSGLTLLVKEPPRPLSTVKDQRALDWRETLGALRVNRAYVLAVAGYTASTFSAGALADWLPAYLIRMRGFDTAGAGGVIGMVTVSGGILGTLAGGAVADRLRGLTRQPYFALSAVTMMIGALFTALVLLSHARWMLIGGMFCAHFFLWSSSGPINATLVNVTSARYRARAFALSILSMHLLGDAISPFVVGAIADLSHSLPLALALIPVGFTVAALLWALAWRRLPE